jgi:cytosine/creatinine deaminase
MTELEQGMCAAIEQARRSGREGGIPIGAALTGPGGEMLSAGHNRRVQCDSPTRHAEIDCLERAGRMVPYSQTTLYSTLMPCYMCAGAIVQFAIPRVIVGESRTFPGAAQWLQERGVDVVDLDLRECHQMLQAFITAHPEVWLEDIGRAG